MGNKISLEDEMINLKITSKQMVRSSKKCEKNEKAAITKLKKVSKLWRHDSRKILSRFDICDYPT